MNYCANGSVYASESVVGFCQTELSLSDLANSVFIIIIIFIIIYSSLYSFLATKNKKLSRLFTSFSFHLLHPTSLTTPNCQLGDCLKFLVAS